MPIYVFECMTLVQSRQSVTLSQVYVTVYVTGLACGASDVMASVCQMSCHVMLKLPLCFRCETAFSFAR